MKALYVESIKKKPVDTTAKEGYGVILGRPLGTTKKWGMLVRETCECHSRGEDYGVGIRVT